MRKTDTFAHAAKIVALCLPPVVMSLIGLAALSRKKGRLGFNRQTASPTPPRSTSRTSG